MAEHVSLLPPSCCKSREGDSAPGLPADLEVFKFHGCPVLAGPPWGVGWESPRAGPAPMGKGACLAALGLSLLIPKVGDQRGTGKGTRENCGGGGEVRFLRPAGSDGSPSVLPAGRASGAARCRTAARAAPPRCSTGCCRCRWACAPTTTWPASPPSPRPASPPTAPSSACSSPTRAARSRCVRCTPATAPSTPAARSPAPASTGSPCAPPGHATRASSCCSSPCPPTPTEGPGQWRQLLGQRPPGMGGGGSAPSPHRPGGPCLCHLLRQATSASPAPVRQRGLQQTPPCVCSLDPRKARTGASPTPVGVELCSRRPGRP